MSARFNHMIIPARSREESAAFYRRLLEAEAAPSWGAFANVVLDDGVLLQFAQSPVEIAPQHFAFLVTDDHFERAMARIRSERRQHWADPQRRQPGRTNTEHGGRGVYLIDPAGHYLELLTRPYL